MDYRDIAHRWANQQFGKYCNLTSGNISCNKTNFKSYSTVIGQWLDKEKKVMALLDSSPSISSSRHISYLKMSIPSDVHVFPFSIDGDIYNPRSNVDLLGYSVYFGAKDRMRLVRIYIDRLYKAYRAIPNSKALTDGDICAKQYLSYINKLNALYNNDASLKKYLEEPLPIKSCPDDNSGVKKKKMVRALIKGKSNAEVVDAMFGKGTWKAWEERVSGQSKAQKTKAYTAKVCKYFRAETDDGYQKPLFTSKELKKMPVRQLSLYKFASIYRNSEEYKARKQHREDSRNRAAQFIGIELDDKYYSKSITRIVNRFTGKVVWSAPKHCYDYGDKVSIQWDGALYKKFCSAPDKNNWLKHFYTLCELKSRRIKGYLLYQDVEDGKMSVENLSDEDVHIYNEYVARREQEIKERRESLRIANEAYVAEREAKLLKIEAYRKQGYEGLRNIWRNKLDSIPNGCRNDVEYFLGGNVLMRQKDEKTVETSKGIKISNNICKKFFKMILEWHNDPSTFQPIDIPTSCGTYKISSYNNDILHAGCHDIAYAEMERIYNLISQ